MEARPFREEFVYRFALWSAPRPLRRWFDQSSCDEIGDLSLHPVGRDQRKLLFLGIQLLAYYQYALSFVVGFVSIGVVWALHVVFHVWHAWMMPISFMVMVGGPIFGIALSFLLLAVKYLPPGSATARWLLNLSPLVWPLGGLAFWELLAFAGGGPKL